MNTAEIQFIGRLAENGEADGRQNVFINSASSIQYMVKPLMLPNHTTTYVTGYLGSFDSDYSPSDDEYLMDEERIEKFMKQIESKLFIYSYKYTRDSGYLKMIKTFLVEQPSIYDSNTLFYSIPVFAPKDTDIIKQWQEEKRWNLFRNFNSLEELKECLNQKKPVGGLYGYNIDDFTPSFVIWRTNDGKLLAIGNITSIRNDTKDGIILDSDGIFEVDINEYYDSIIYDMEINPTIIFIPDNIYKIIEDKIMKLSVTLNKNETEQVDDNKQNTIIVDIVNEEKTTESQENENIINIDISEKDDSLIINAMDYHSQKRNLYYSRKDFINFHTSIKCNNLIILSGLSGIGKSALVDIYARAIGINNSTNIIDNRMLFIPVRPSWNDDSDLLGYVDLVHMVYRASDTGFVDFLVKAQKEENKSKIFIVVFDEMNLARVEHYFSQFLSILERPLNQREIQLYDDQYSGRLYNSSSYPSRLKIGDNIRFVGTVNIDESTYHFSDKVLDRANVIHLDILNYSEEWIKKPYGTLPNLNWTYDDYINIIVQNSDMNMQQIRNLLWDIHQLMQTAGSKYGIGPRIVKSIEFYMQNLPKKEYEDFDSKIGLDYQICQRVLTKVRGPENQLGSILNGDSEINFERIFDKYSSLSDFTRSRNIVKQKQKELETYGYCI